MTRPPITCHVLDQTIGRPAVGMQVVVEQLKQDEMALVDPEQRQRERSPCAVLAHALTDQDGRCSSLFEPGTELAAGLYKLVFCTGEYYRQKDQKTIYPIVEITFDFSPDQHYHIPLLVSPFSYTTYRGS